MEGLLIMGDFFDETARILASPLSRGQALRLIGGAFLGGVLGALTGCGSNGGCKNGTVLCAACAQGECCPSSSPWYCDGSCYSSGCPHGTVCSAHCG
jgi:hypothetical protein